MKKAQAVMEFLMTYGCAILVVLIAICALIYFIDPSEMSDYNKCECLDFDLHYESYSKIELGNYTYKICYNDAELKTISFDEYNLVHKTYTKTKYFLLRCSGISQELISNYTDKIYS